VKCLIIAAGQGSRLRQTAESKPLVPLLGIPLIERVILSAAEGGADEFYVVSGYQGERVRRYLDGMSANEGIIVHHIVNERWQKPNGLSVLKASDYLSGSFLLLMADHLFDPTIVSELLKEPLMDGLILAVDKRLGNPLVDLQDVTRVQCNNGFICEIGKGIETFNAFDTGIFYCSSSLFGAIEASDKKNADASLSGGVRYLAKLGKAKVFDIEDRFWLDIDDSRSYVKAEVTLGERIKQQRQEVIKRSAIA